MKADSKRAPEPVGIVIAGMPEVSDTTVFSAYIWGLAPSKSKTDEPKTA